MPEPFDTESDELLEAELTQLRRTRAFTARAVELAEAHRQEVGLRHQQVLSRYAALETELENRYTAAAAKLGAEPDAPDVLTLEA